MGVYNSSLCSQLRRICNLVLADPDLCLSSVAYLTSFPATLLNFLGLFLKTPGNCFLAFAWSFLSNYSKVDQERLWHNIVPLLLLHFLQHACLLRISERKLNSNTPTLSTAWHCLLVKNIVNDIVHQFN